PVRSNGQPSGSLPAGTTQTTIGVTTNEPASCRYATTAGVAYAAMPSPFATTGGTAHSTLITAPANGGSSLFDVRCQDAAGHANTNDVAIVFSIAVPPDTAIPVVTMTAP